MFSDLKAIIDLLISAAKGLRSLKKGNARRQNAIGLLKIYFFIQSILADGGKLLSAVLPSPKSVISALDQEETDRTLREWEKVLKRQRTRLLAVNDLIRGQRCLTVVNPKLQARISEVIGEKFQRASKLYCVANGLYFFGFLQDDGWQCEIINAMYELSEDGLLDIDESRRELDQLATALESYRGVLNRFLSNEELVALSKIAEAETRAAERAVSSCD